MESLFVVALWLFAVTHLDTLVVLVAFCADEEYRTGEVFVGHYLGFLLGLGAALVATFFAAEVLQERAFVLGVLPVALGVRGFIKQRTELDSVDTPVTTSGRERIGIVAAAGVGLSGENVAIYVPFFIALQEPTLVAAIVGIYLVGGGVVFLVSLLIARRTLAVGTPRWVDRLLVPTVLVAVGLYVLAAGWFAV